VAFACSCIGSGSGIFEYGESEAVFTGQVTNIEYPQPKNNMIGSADKIKVSLNVIQSWKGPNAKNVVIQTNLNGASCGYQFEKNSEYLVYAGNIKGNLEVSFCSRTSLLSAAQAKEDISSFSNPTAKASYMMLFILPFLPFIGLGIL